ncbi:hypothetical protein Cdeb_00632 [Caldibacillus debilis GB1]|jgi:hypothetical protein|uniref:Uncharacterized protein n=1 Tax=Caldibacillus debilis GB1 TaxID=1339248 RepID=A0A420VHQ1_9BACI|nr:hypothetical protein Cdeb_00632 [Caldibacillus debilis GB1]
MKNASEATGFLSLNRPGIRLGGVFCSCLMTELDVRPILLLFISVIIEHKALLTTVIEAADSKKEWAFFKGDAARSSW